MFTNEGLFQSAALFATSTSESIIAVKHGWSAINESMRVTKAYNNIVYEIEYRPAFLVYQEIVNKCSPEKISNDNFFEVAKNFPLGIPKLDNEYIIRDPLKLGENNSIEFIANIPENSFIHIMNGTKESLIKSSEDAVKLASDGKGKQTFLTMDCISRALFLQNDFSKELENITGAENESVGALVFGEIANQGKEYLELYNKTIVICNLKND